MDHGACVAGAAVLYVAPQDILVLHGMAWHEPQHITQHHIHTTPHLTTHTHAHSRTVSLVHAYGMHMA